MSNKMFLVEKGRFVVIRTTGGDEVHFSSFEEFYAYCPLGEFGIDLTGKNYIDYEPDRGLHIDESLPGPGPIPCAPYEWIIAHFDIVRDRRNDPYHTLSTKEAVAAKEQELAAMADYQIQAKYPIQEQLLYAFGVKSKTEGAEGARFSQMISDMAAIVASAEALIEDVKTVKSKDELYDAKYRIEPLPVEPPEEPKDPVEPEDPIIKDPPATKG